MGIGSSLQAVGSILAEHRSWWRVVLTTGQVLSERQLRFDLRVGGLRPFDWAHDLTDNGDVLKIKELYLECPPNQQHPGGQVIRLDISEPGTAFQFKTASVDTLGANQRVLEAQVIGRVDDKENGLCTCYIWDAKQGGPTYNPKTEQFIYLGGLVTQERDGEVWQDYQTSIYTFGSWREGIAPIGALSHEVMGLRIGYLSSYSPHNP